MKKRIMILAGSLLAIAAVATTVVATNSNDDMSLLAQNIEALAQSESGSQGTLMSNQAGDYYCCCPGSSSCGAADCPSNKC